MDAHDFIHWMMRKQTSTAILVYVSAVFCFVGVVSFAYPAGYLYHPWVWSTLLVLASMSGGLFTVAPSRWSALLAGTGFVGTSLVRSMAIFGELGLERFFKVVTATADRPQDVSFTVAGTTWMMIGVLIWALWPMLVAGVLEDG